MKIKKKFNIITLIIIAVTVSTQYAFYHLAMRWFEGKTALILCLVSCISLAVIALLFIRSYVTKKIVLPLKNIHADSLSMITEISKGNFNNKIAVKTGDEIEELADNFNKMVSVCREEPQCSKRRRKRNSMS